MPLSIDAWRSSLSPSPVTGGVSATAGALGVTGGVAPSSTSRSLRPLFSKSMYLKWIDLICPELLAPGTRSPTAYAPCFWFSLLMIVAYDSSGVGPMLVASSASGSDVIATDDGSDDTLTSTVGVQSEQNMLRPASCAPSLLRAATTGVSGRGMIAATLGPWSGSPRYLASTMCAVALAANTAHTITTTPPSTQK